MLEKKRELIILIIERSAGKKIENILWIMYKPGGVVILGSQL
jgi:hypothetical protein